MRTATLIQRVFVALILCLFPAAAIAQNCTAPAVTTQPQSIHIAQGQSTALAVGASGTAPLTVTWFTSAGAQVGVGNPFPVTPTATTSYFARVSNGCGLVQSAAMTVTVSPCGARAPLPLRSTFQALDVLVLGDGFRETQADCTAFWAGVRQLESELNLSRNSITNPYGHMLPYIHVTGYLDYSQQSGASHRRCTDPGGFTPPTGTPEPLSQNGTRDYFINTRYSISYCANGQTERLLAPLRPDSTGVRSVVDWAWLEVQGDQVMPGADAVMVLVNEPRWGGTANGRGDRIATVPSLPLINRSDILQHELGHSLLRLGDEYTSVASQTPGATTCGCDDNAPSLAARCPPNISSFNSPAASVKWAAWYRDSTGPATIDEPPVHRGATYPGCFRPSAACKMLSAGSDFCVVCREQGIESLWAHSRFIGSASPAPAALPGIINQPIIFAVRQTAPAHQLRYQWKINGGTAASDASPNELTFIPDSAGLHVVSVVVDDPTPYVKPQPNRETETQTWRITVPAALQLATSGTNPVQQQVAVNIPANTTSVTLEYSVASNEPGGRAGDPWSILVAFSGSTSAPIYSKSGRAVDPSGVPTTKIEVSFKASSTDRTAILALSVQNGEEADFAESTLTASLVVKANCGANCDPCQLNPPGPGCPIPVDVIAQRVKVFTDYDEAFYRIENFPRGDESYFSLPQGEPLTHDRYLQFKIDTVNHKELRAIATVLDAGGNEIQKAADRTAATFENSSFGPDGAWLMFKVTPFQLAEHIPDEKKSHVIQYKMRFIVTLHDNRVGETESIVRVVDPAARTLLPLHALYKAPMPPTVFRNEFADMRYASAGAYRWLKQHWQDPQKFPQTGRPWGQISGEHTLGFNNGAPWGTDIEVYLWPAGLNEVSAAFDLDNTAARNAVAEGISILRARVDALISHDKDIAQVRMPLGTACTSVFQQCKHDLPNGWVETLLLNGRLTDRKGKVLDLTGDPRVGAPWTIDVSRLAYDDWRGPFELVLDRCRLGEVLGPCNTGRPPGSGKNFRILTHPVGANIRPGASADLAVVAEGPDLQYRWYAGVARDFNRSTPVPGGTVRDIRVTPEVTTTYWVYVWNETGNEMSNGALVDVCTPATVAVAPSPQTIDYADGGGATLSVLGAGSEALSYRWLDAAGNPLGTSPSIFIATKQTATYTAEVTNRCGIAQAQATITVRPCVPPALAFQSPSTVNLNPGQQTTLSVTATGSPNLRYRWFANGVDTGITSASLPLTPTVTATYHATVANDCGTVQSQTFNVNVCVLPSVATQPESKNIIRGDSVKLSIAAAGSEPRAITWRTGDGTPAGGGPSIDVAPNVTTTYIARVSNACGAVDSNPATVSVCIPPSIAIGPESKTITLGDTVKLSVTANGDAPLAYQWFRNDAAMPGANASTLEMTPAETASYHVVVTNGCSTASSGTVTVTVVCIAATIAEPPKPVSIVEDDGTTLSVTAGGTAPFTYQWYQGSTLMQGQTSDRLSVAPPATTQYSVKVTNACGSITSSPVTVTVTPRCIRPFIGTHPKSETILAGASVELSVTVNGTSPFEYQWYADGISIDDATEPKYVATPTATTSYYVVITNPCNTATSSIALITVERCDVPVIGTPPAPAVIESGDSALLSVTATGSAPLTYQWYANGTKIAGAVERTYTASPTVSTNYHVVVTNPCGTVASSPALVTVGVCESPSIAGTGQPQPTAVDLGQQATLRVTASGSAVLNYQWYANGNLVPGENASAYTLTPSATASYHVAVSNACGTIVSNTVTVTVNCAQPVMGLQPKSETIESGQSVTLLTTASGLQPFTREWYANGSPIPNSNSSSLLVTPTVTTQYHVVVSNVCGSTASNVATITVQTCVAARIINAPDDVTIAPGGNTTLTVVAAGTQTRSYEWRTAAGALIGTGTSVNVSPSATTTYTIRVSNACGSETHTVTVSVVDCPLPVITFQPRSAEVWQGNPVVMEILVGASATTLSYQWYANGELMPGRVTRAIDLGPATVTTTYYVKVTNACGTVQSTTATITVKPCTKPQFTSHPQSSTIADGESATLSAAATSTAPLTYTLIQEGGITLGSNSTGVFSIRPQVAVPGALAYVIVAQTGCGSTVSNTAIVTVTAN